MSKLLSKTCKQCGERIAPGSKKCKYCGITVSAGDKLETTVYLSKEDETLEPWALIGLYGASVLFPVAGIILGIYHIATGESASKRRQRGYSLLLIGLFFTVVFTVVGAGASR